MRQTLFFIPDEVFGLPVFGFGLLLAVFALVAGIFTVDKIRRQGFNADTQSSLLFYALIGAAIAFVLPRIAEPGHGLPIRGYGVMLMLAVVLSIALALVRARQVGADPDMLLSLAIWVFVAGLVGARALYVAEYWRDFQRPTVGATIGAVLNVTKGGLVVYGGLIGAALAFVWRVYRCRLPALALADVVVASLALGQGIGRVGCLLNGCCYGGACEAPLPSITFPWGSPAHVRQVQTGKLFLHGLKLPLDTLAAPVIQDVAPGSPAEKAGLKAGERVVAVSGKPDAEGRDFFQPLPTTGKALDALFSVDGETNHDYLSIITSDGTTHRVGSVDPNALPRSVPVHPTQIYSAINGLVVCLFLWFVFPFRRRDGEVLAWGLTVFPITRFLMEWVRTDEPQNFLFGMTISQTISVGLLTLAVGLWLYLLAKPKHMLAPGEWAAHNRRWAAA